MSNLRATMDGADAAPCTHPRDGLTLLQPRQVPLGGPRAMLVQRSLPHRDIRTVGAWCFIDHFGPVEGGPAMHVPPHPHTGLQTVTWLLEGDVEHRDSIGSRTVVRPGELNLMTAGRGIAHSEDTVPPPAGAILRQHGVQLWVALPEADRFVEPHFEHHADLPQIEDAGARVSVLVGELLGARSPAAAYTPLVGAQVHLAGGARVRVPLEPEFEHGVLALTRGVEAAGVPLPTSALLHVDAGRRELTLAGVGPGNAVALLIGGTPLTEDLLMWWNFVGRDHDEIAQFRQDWAAGRRFGRVEHPVAALPAPALPTTRLRARPGRRRA